MADQKFHCEKGHIWVGSEPVCPLHGIPAIETQNKTQKPRKKSKQQKKPKVTQAAKIQHLRCQIGEHDWERPAQRGKPPRNCPEHQPPKPEPSERRPRNVDGTTIMTRPKLLTLSEIHQQYPNVDDESARVFAYVEREISAPTWPRGREQEDINLLVKTYNNRLRAVARSSHVPGPVLVEA